MLFATKSLGRKKAQKAQTVKANLLCLLCFFAAASVLLAAMQLARVLLAS